MTALLTAIEYHLGERIETNADLAAEHPEWDMARLVAKLGVRQRCLSRPGETASDLAVRAAEKLFASGACTPDEIDFILFCTQTPDHLIPTTACQPPDPARHPVPRGRARFQSRLLRLHLRP